MIAKVYVGFIDFSIDKLYDYSVPPAFENEIKMGSRVVVPFGKGNKKIEAVVIKCESQSQFQKLKPILSIVDQPVSKKILDFAAFIKENYFCTFYDALKLMLVPGAGFKFIEKVSVNKKVSINEYDDIEQQIIEFVKNNKEIEISEFLNKFKNEKQTISKLYKDGVLVSNYFEAKQVFDKTIKTVSVIDNKELAFDYFSKGKRNQKIHKEIYDVLSSSGAMSVKEICYITGCSSSVLSTMEKNGLIEILETQVNRKYYDENDVHEKNHEIELNDEQSKAYDGIKQLLDQKEACGALLFGVTGSGKTLVYMRLIEQVIKSGKTAILLVPEISLSPQVFTLFFKKFGSQVALLHSKMSIGERRDEYNRIKNKEAKIVIGTRMAVFANLENIGVIIIDEEQEHTYKSEQNPRYDTLQVAKYRCTKENALLLLGSATPSLESYYYAKTGRYKFFSLENRFGGTLLPSVEIVDMAKELKNGNTGVISSYLIHQLKQNILNNQQSILYLNRRGHSTFVSCVECGFVVKCKNCSIPMRLHKKNNRLICHYCGYSQSNIESCPKCQNTLIKFLGAGTQKIEEHILQLVPSARVIRMDADTTMGKKSHDLMINDFNNHKADILVGTQMVTKGLDFENVTLVGVLNADLGLFSDDFRASEITFSQITQVIGRAGRRNVQGRAIIQTLAPDSEVLKFCINADYEGFYNYEIGLRKLLIYPPFCDLVTLTVSSIYEEVADNMALELDKIIKRNLKLHKEVKIIILGPSKPSIFLINNKYRNRVILKCKNNAKLRSFLNQVILEFNSFSKGRKAALIVDINPPTLI